MQVHHDDVTRGPDGVGVVPASARELIRVVREDASRYGTPWLAPGLHATTLHRFRTWAGTPGVPRPVRALARRVYQAGFLLVRTVHGIELPHTVSLGRRVRIAHQHGIVVHPHASIGDDCVVRQGVSLGAGSGDPATFARQAPQIGRGVSLGAGCCVVGRVRVGDGATIGPNAVVMTHVPAGATVLAQPPRVLRPAAASPVGQDDPSPARSPAPSPAASPATAP